VAYDVPQRAINLPSGHERTEEEIDYICGHIRDILGAKKAGKTAPKQPWGWLEFRDKVNKIIYDIKNPKAKEKFFLAMKDKGVVTGMLRPLTTLDTGRKPIITLLAKWRDKIQEWFPAQFKVTYEGTKKWLENGVIGTKDRILFMVEDKKGKPVGHVGLFRFNYIERACEIDNIVRGEDGVFKGAMFSACKTLLNWAFDSLGIEAAYLRVVSDNERAIALYEKLGYREIQRVPLVKLKEPGVTRWVEVIGRPYMEIKRYFVTMKLEKKDWEKKNG
jgi:RimJ/RimL family protein N-acetyltransferase